MRKYSQVNNTIIFIIYIFIYEYNSKNNIQIIAEAHYNTYVLPIRYIFQNFLNKVSTVQKYQTNSLDRINITENYIIYATKIWYLFQIINLSNNGKISMIVLTNILCDDWQKLNNLMTFD